MSKFYFKGRQDARQNYVGQGYQAKGTQKAGSKKHPLLLVVTSEERKREVEAMVAEALLYADIEVDTSENAVESISELTTALNIAATVTTENTPARNEPCSCGSGKKFKKCCG